MTDDPDDLQESKTLYAVHGDIKPGDYAFPFEYQLDDVLTPSFDLREGHEVSARVIYAFEACLDINGSLSKVRAVVASCLFLTKRNNAYLLDIPLHINTTTPFDITLECTRTFNCRSPSLNTSWCSSRRTNLSALTAVQVHKLVTHSTLACTLQNNAPCQFASTASSPLGPVS